MSSRSRAPAAGTALACALLAASGAGACMLTLPVLDPPTECAGYPARFDASSLQVADCAGPTEYRFRDGPAVLRDWSTDPVYSWSPTTSFPLAIDIRCSTDPTCSGSDQVAVTVVPDRTPEPVGNTLRALRSGDAIQLLWEPSAGSLYSRVRTSTDKSFQGNTVVAERPRAHPSVSLVPDPLPAPSCRHYRVAGVGCSLDEGP